MDRKRAELAGQARRRVDARARDARAADRVGALDGEAALERELDRVLALRVELLAQRQGRYEARGRATLDRRGRVAELRGLLEVGRSVDRGRHRVGSPRERNKRETQAGQLRGRWLCGTCRPIPTTDSRALPAISERRRRPVLFRVRHEIATPEKGPEAIQR